VRRGDEEVLDDVVLLRLRAAQSAPAAPLAPVLLGGRPFDVPRVGDRDHHVLFGDQILNVEYAVVLVVRDLRSPRVPESIPQRHQVVPDEPQHAGTALQDLLQLGDPGGHRRVLVIELLALQAGQALEAQLEDGIGLPLRQVEVRHQACPGGVDVHTVADQRDDGIQVVECPPQPLQDVGPRLRLRQLEPAAPHDHVVPVVEERLQHPLQVEHHRAVLLQRQQVHAEGRLHLRVLVELVQHD